MAANTNTKTRRLFTYVDQDNYDHIPEISLTSIPTQLSFLEERTHVVRRRHGYKDSTAAPTSSSQMTSADVLAFERTARQKGRSVVDTSFMVLYILFLWYCIYSHFLWYTL